MALLSRKVDYAILILSFLARQPAGGSAREIAARYGLSQGFVANILKLLCHKGFVTSHRGVKGGYVLQRPARDVALADLMDALDGSFRLTECTGHEPNHDCSLSDVCPVRGAVTRVHMRIRDVLRDVTLADLFEPSPVSPGTMQLGLTLTAALSSPTTLAEHAI